MSDTTTGTFDVTVRGCDEQTDITVDLTSSEFAFLIAIAEKITAASQTGCMPKMAVVPHFHGDDCTEVHP